jgi:putative transposase
MHTVSYRRHRFPAKVIQHAVWLYFRFPLSIRDVEDLLAQRGVGVVTLSEIGTIWGSTNRLSL